MKGEMEKVLYYLSCRVEVSCNIGSQISCSWYFPVFLLSEGSLTLMNLLMEEFEVKALSAAPHPPTYG